jgi:aldehyde:ferredoxin oxidoreductase
VGPVKAAEYESRADRYDKQLVEKHNVDITGKTTEEKIMLLRKFREKLYEELKDAVYRRRGWTNNGIPTLETVTRLGIDYPEVLELLRDHGIE